MTPINRKQDIEETLKALQRIKKRSTSMIVFRNEYGELIEDLRQAANDCKELPYHVLHEVYRLADLN